MSKRGELLATLLPLDWRALLDRLIQRYNSILKDGVNHETKITAVLLDVRDEFLAAERAVIDKPATGPWVYEKNLYRETWQVWNPTEVISEPRMVFPSEIQAVVVRDALNGADTWRVRRLWEVVSAANAFVNAPRGKFNGTTYMKAATRKTLIHALKNVGAWTGGGKEPSSKSELSEWPKPEGHGSDRS